MTLEFINGYLEAAARVKDIITPNLGGSFLFFSIPEDPAPSLPENIRSFIRSRKAHYISRSGGDGFSAIVEETALREIHDWQEQLPAEIGNWTGDASLESIAGAKGYRLSEHLVQQLLAPYFKTPEVRAYHLLPDWGVWHWGNRMSEEFVFETPDSIPTLHFGEST